jgi:hypothetical protein
MRVGYRLTKHPLFLLLPLQAGLLFWRLDRLPPWGDEEMTRRVCTAAPADALRLLANDIHPPLYFWIARAWLQIPWAADPITVLRGLSALFALATGVVVYARWVRQREDRTRWWFTALWASSPFLVLYGRMARSYTLQMLLGVLAVAAAERLVSHRGAHAAAGSVPHPPASLGRTLPAYIVASTLLLYTHYLPGIAVIASVAAVLLWRVITERQPALLAPLLLPPAAIGVLYAPWLSNLLMAAQRFAHPVPYTLTAVPLLDRFFALAYVIVSFTFGEALPIWAIALAVLAAPAVAWIAIAGSACRPAWLGVVAIAAVLAFAAASRWVSYAFVTARLSFVYPFWLLLLAYGIGRRARLGQLGGAAVLAIGVGAIGNYLRMDNFLNKAYVVPVQAIAARIASDSVPAQTVVLIDPHGAQLDASLARRLPATVEILELRDDTAAEARRRSFDPNTRTVWIVRSTIDRSPDRWVSALEAALGDRFERRDHLYVRYSALDRIAMRLVGWRERPTHVIDAVELRRRE